MWVVKPRVFLWSRGHWLLPFPPSSWVWKQFQLSCPSQRTVALYSCRIGVGVYQGQLALSSAGVHVSDWIWQRSKLVCTHSILLWGHWASWGRFLSGGLRELSPESLGEKFVGMVVFPGRQLGRGEHRSGKVKRRTEPCLDQKWVTLLKSLGTTISEK